VPNIDAVLEAGGLLDGDGSRYRSRGGG